MEINETEKNNLFEPNSGNISPMVAEDPRILATSYMMYKVGKSSRHVQVSFSS